MLSWSPSSRSSMQLQAARSSHSDNLFYADRKSADM
jgi:hypothetical protein